MGDAEHDLSQMMMDMRPTLREQAYVYIRLDEGGLPPNVQPVVTVAEDEACTVVCAKDEADVAGLSYNYVAAWITLQVHSALAAVGLTSAVSTALADAGLSCNVVAGYYHDHLFVRYEEGPRALEILTDLGARATNPPG